MADIFVQWEDKEYAALELEKECPKQPLFLHDFNTGHYDHDRHGCGINTITLALNDTMESLFYTRRTNSYTVLGSFYAVTSVFLLLGWILTAVICHRKRYTTISSAFMAAMAV